MAYYQVIVHPSAPIRCINDPAKGGLQLVARRDLSFQELNAGLYGFVTEEIGEADFETLMKEHYPSLFDGNRILFGPLSLINHSCTSDFRFTNPSSKTDSMRKTDSMPAYLNEFKVVRLKNMSSSSSSFISAKKRTKTEPIVFYKDHPITVKYGMTQKDFDCLCDACEEKKERESAPS
jgi:hypothetical protein